MKNARQQKILEIIEKYNIDTQEALIIKLKEAGYIVTQTTISRDINQLTYANMNDNTPERKAKLLEKWTLS